MSVCTCTTQCCQEVQSLQLQVSACAVVRWSLWFTVRACHPFSSLLFVAELLQSF